MSKFKENLLKHPLGIVVYDLIFSAWIALIIYLIIAPGGYYVLGLNSLKLHTIGLFTSIASFIVMAGYLNYKHKWELEGTIIVDGDEEDDNTEKHSDR